MASQDAFTATVADALRRIFGSALEIAGIAELTDGPDNKSYLARAGGTDMVVKLPNVGPGISLPAEAEVDIIARVAEIGLGPRVLGYDAAAGVIVTEYLAAASPWSPETAVMHENIDRMAAALSALHELRAEIRPFEPLHWAKAYIAECAETMSRSERLLADELLRLAEEYGADEEPVLCHNDLVAENVLDDGRVWIIDFEYAVAAPASVDIASFAAMNDFSEACLERLIDAYSARRPLPHGVSAIANIARIHKLIAHFWSAAQRVRGARHGPA